MSALIEDYSKNDEFKNESHEKKPLKNSDSDSNSDNGDFQSKIREELSSISFADLMKLKEKLGAKVYNEAIFGQKKSRNKDVVKGSSRTEFKRANKNRPREISSKRPVPFLGTLGSKAEKKIETRDPRFDVKCGEYNSKIFKENYSFINEVREKEINDLKDQFKNETNEEERKQIKFLIQRLENQNREEKKRKIKEEILKEEKEEIKKARTEGRNPHYRTKKERRTRELIKQFEELRNTGKLRKHLEKRRKKNTAKDRKKLSFE